MKPSKKEIRRLDRVARHYNAYKDFDYHLIRYSAHAIREHLPKKKPAVLELGCSSGVMTELLAPASGRLDVVDGSARYIRQAKRKNRFRQVRFYQGLFETFSSPIKYDAIIMASILEHVYSPRRILRHIKRFLKPGGKIHITVPNAHSLHRHIGLALGLISDLKEFSKRDIQLGHRRIYDEKTLASDIRHSGLRIVHAGGIFLKPLSNRQMEAFPQSVLEEFFKLGKTFPGLCNYLYRVVQAR